MTTLNYTKKSIWENLSCEQHEAMNVFAKKYMDFISTCKTERECINYAAKTLEEHGYTSNWESDFFVTTLHGKALFAVRKGKKKLSEGFHLISAHSDSPRLDFKQNPLLETVGIGQAKTHYYGGIRKYQWLARPLALHGIVIKQNGESVNIVLGENEDDPVFTIADLLPHLAKDHGTQPLSTAFAAEKLNIILGHSPLQETTKADNESEKEVTINNVNTDVSDENNTKKDVEKVESPIKQHILTLLHEKYGIIEEDLLSAEIQAVPAGKARFVGLYKALIGAYGHDDRICMFTGLEAFLSEEQPEHTSCLIFWDKEEIGSEGSTGASSRFFEYCVQDMIDAWDKDCRFSSLMLASKAISADVHAAIDPDWQELHEKLNSSIMGYGPTLCKFTGSGGKYGANDAHPEYIAWLRNIFAENNVTWQMASLGKVDHGGGGTVALFLAVYGMNVIDMGPSLLGMHSPFELASVADLFMTKEAYKAFYQAC